jgi:hypothetical protein
LVVWAEEQKEINFSRFVTVSSKSSLKLSGERVLFVGRNSILSGLFEKIKVEKFKASD